MGPPPLQLADDVLEVEPSSADTRRDAEAPAPVVAPPPGHPRFRLLDSLRAVAALSVLVGHVGFISHTQQAHWYGAIMGSLVEGVAIFFVLSGFLLYRPFFSSEVEGTPRPGLRDFTRRRLLRIVPAYWLALTVLAITPGLLGVFTHDWWRYYGFLQIYNPFTRESGLTVAWTLCIEVTFYLALPLYAALTRWATRGLDRAGRVRFQLATLTTLGLASIVFGVGLHGSVAPSLLTFFDWFAFGMGLAVISVAVHSRVNPPRLVRLVIDRPAMTWAVALVIYLTMCALLASAPQYAFYSHAQNIVDHVGRGLVAFFLVAPAVFGDSAGGWPRRILDHRSLRWLGGISYGVYLWHLTIAQWLYGKGVHSFWPLLIATFVAATACAAGSYYVVERPILRFKDGRPRLRPRARVVR
jgi:peptidoglycan/LPS O-acetylase OafA/YrhL